MPRGCYPRPSARERFDAKWKADDASGCWLWTAAIDIGGYGSFSPTRVCTARAHRYAWELHNGPIPEGMLLDHVCRVRRCVNPAHLRLATHRQNSIENSESIPAMNAQKTACDHGHPFTPENTYLWHGRRNGLPRLVRKCRACEAAKDRRRRARHRADAARSAAPSTEN